MKMPVILKIVLVTVGATAFYGYVGQLVPQKEVHPPEVVEIAEDLSPTEMAEIGKAIFDGKGICSTCHTIGKSGALRFPDLDGIATRAATRRPGYNALDYLAEALYEPDIFLVEGFNPGMPAINKPPVGLTDGEILTVIAYLQSLGGTPTVTTDTKLVYTGGTLGGGTGGGEGDGAAEGDAAAVEEGTQIATSAAEPGSPAGMLQQYGCDGCHSLDGSQSLAGPSLHDVGARLGYSEILTSTLVHKTNIPDSDYSSQLTLNEIQTMVGYLAQSKGAP
ncbi:MAG: c-type cytochrome [Deltaproteobacteria bacterium]|nr:c-type cytochrome [Deltaproteobacteria bacterium]